MGNARDDAYVGTAALGLIFYLFRGCDDSVRPKSDALFQRWFASIELPVYKGTVGPDVIDIRKLYAQMGRFTYDPGFMSTASCKSAITYIDGDKGELLYRGYPIEELATQCDFPEISYLLLKGELPNPEQKQR